MVADPESPAARAFSAVVDSLVGEISKKAVEAEEQGASEEDRSHLKLV